MNEEPTNTNERSAEEAALHLIVHGRVQGVGFRYFTQTNAKEMGVVGWVRNRADGTVEIWAEGPRATLDRFASVVRQGPRSSMVTKMEAESLSAKHEFDTFSTRW